MKQIHLGKGQTHEYPPEKAKTILEEDGVHLMDDELEHLVAALTLLAQKEAELLIEKKIA